MKKKLIIGKKANAREIIYQASKLTAATSAHKPQKIVANQAANIATEEWFRRKVDTYI